MTKRFVAVDEQSWLDACREAESGDTITIADGAGVIIEKTEDLPEHGVWIEAKISTLDRLLKAKAGTVRLERAFAQEPDDFALELDMLSAKSMAQKLHDEFLSSTPEQWTADDER